MNSTPKATTDANWFDAMAPCVSEIVCGGINHYAESRWRENGYGDMDMSWDNYGNGIGCGGVGHGTIFGDGQSNTYEVEWPDDQS